MMNTLRAGTFAALTLLACGTACATEVSYIGKDVVSFVVRESSAGTSIDRARVQEKATAPGSIGASFKAIADAALGGCPAIDRVTFEPALSQDTIGESSTRLQGLGVYAAFSDMSARGGRSLAGESFLAPFFSIKVSIAGRGSEPPASTTLFEFSKAEVDSTRLSRSEFLDMDAAKVQQSVLAFARPKVEAAISSLVKGRCS
ncbi:MAG TPA: hypothetical protein VFE23_14650 [Usitatibacter sp.]|jgi:hypothetical protein|nr:hypothetical protein [Usitatibacter sp.]